MPTKTTKSKVVKKKVKKVVVLDASNIESTLAQRKSLAFPYTASIKVFGRVYTSEGATLQEAFDNLKISKVGGVCVMKVTHGEKTKEKILNGGQLTRLFSQSRLMHEIALKNVMSIFGDI